MFAGRVNRPCHPRGTPPVAGSRPSKVRLCTAPKATAASATVRPGGPKVSWMWEIGTMPARLVRPTVGLSPTTPFALAGHTMLPSVSVPNDTAAKFDDTAAPDPALEPQGLRLMPYGLFVCPPRPDHPLTDSKERKLAHSPRFVFPRMTAPPARRLAATVESVSAGFPTSANEPAVVCIMSPVSTLSLSSTGIPCKGPSTMPCLRSRSACRAISSASGFNSITELTPGPLWSSATMRAMYSLVSSADVSLPDAISAWSWATVASLCCLGTLGDSLFFVASFAAARVSARKAGRRKLRTAGTFILFPPPHLAGCNAGTPTTPQSHYQAIPADLSRLSGPETPHPAWGSSHSATGATPRM